jgi:glycosyltransferase involved in cell wall biosynthesis
MSSVTPGAQAAPQPLLVCFSHLRWDLVVQRPHHLLRRAASTFQVVYFEELVRHDGPDALQVRHDHSGVLIATPHLSHGTADVDGAVRGLLDQMVGGTPHRTLITWYYTPMALSFSSHLAADVCVYDCMDELSAFRFAPDALGFLEDRLFGICDLVFTGGRSLYEAKRHRHPQVFCLPSSIDAAHFAKARAPMPDPDDQRDLPRPRVGFFGVIDERMDLDLVRSTAAALPETQFVMLGPVVKISMDDLPRGPNLRWLGPKPYDALPAYMANWQAGWMPFALNEATRFISPTKTPEFLAAGLRLASTAITDVVTPYGHNGLVAIADAATMPEALRQSLTVPAMGLRARIDDMLSNMSWDRTWATMLGAIDRQLVPVPQVATRMQISGSRNAAVADHV